MMSGDRPTNAVDDWLLEAAAVEPQAAEAAVLRYLARHPEVLTNVYIWRRTQVDSAYVLCRPTANGMNWAARLDSSGGGRWRWMTWRSRGTWEEVENLAEAARAVAKALPDLTILSVPPLDWDPSGSSRRGSGRLVESLRGFYDFFSR